jgi:hypothetical protein
MTLRAKLNQHPPAYHPLDVHYDFHGSTLPSKKSNIEQRINH